MSEKPIPIERDDHVLRARRTAATTRVVLGVVGVVLVVAEPSLLPHPALGVAGFATILLTSLIQLTSSRVSWLRVEESFAGAAAILIVGCGDQRVSVLSVLWLVAVATGVMARGGRVHWIGRTVVLAALALPVLREGRLSGDYAGLCVAVIARSLRHVTDLRPIATRDLTAHYPPTMRAWRERFEAGAERLCYDERFRRLWRLYLSYCEGGFRERRIEVSQMLLGKPEAPSDSRTGQHTFDIAAA